MNNFPAMTEEQRQELIRRIEDLQEDQLCHWTGVYPGSELDRKIWEIALAALTAEPEYNTSEDAGTINLGVTKAAYDRCHPDYRWISYTAPPAPVLRVPDGWIKCSERMPDDYEDVIAGNSGDRNFAWWGDLGWLFPGDKVKGEITHWMPLPPPPEASNEQ